MRKLILSATLFAVFSFPVQGQEILVEATSFAEPQQAVQKVSSQQISIKESLNLLPGLTLSSLSSSVSPRDRFFLRSFSPERVYVYLDEFPLNGSGIRGNFYVDLSTLSPEDIKSIKVVYGPSVVYGANPGGNLIVESKGFPSKRSIEIETLTGSYGTFKTSFSYRDLFRTTGVDVSAEGMRSSGYLRNDFLNSSHGRITLYQMVGDSTVLKVFAEKYRVKDGLPVLNDPSKPVTNYDGDYPVVKETYFSLACAPYCKLNLIYSSGDNYIERTTDRLGFALLRDTGNGLFNTAIYSNKSYKEERYYGFFKTPAGKKLTSMNFDGKDDITYGFRTTYEEFEALGGRGTVGVEFQNSGYGGIDKNGKPFVSANRNALRRYAVFSEFEKELPLFTVRFGVRLEKWKGNSEEGAPDVDGTEFLPALTLSKKLGETEFFAGVGRVYRPPRAEEILWFSREYSKVRAVDSSYDLKAERGWDYELGLRKQTGRFSLTARIYRYELNNFIVSNFNAAKALLNKDFPHRIIENLDYYRLNGAEIEGVLKLTENLSFDSSYTYQDSEVSSSNFTPDKTPDPSVLIPRHKLSLSVTRVNILRNDSLSIFGIFYSHRKGYGERIPGFGVFNLSYTVSPVENIAFNFQLNNILDKKYFYVENYEMPGRNFQLSMKVVF